MATNGITTTQTTFTTTDLVTGGVLSIGSAVFSGYLGGRRHPGSAGWILGMGTLGLFFPIVTPLVLMGLNYADSGHVLGGSRRGRGSRSRRNPSRRRRTVRRRRRGRAAD